MTLADIVQTNKDIIAIGEAGGSIDDVCSVIGPQRVRDLWRLRQLSIPGQIIRLNDSNSFVSGGNGHQMGNVAVAASLEVCGIALSHGL